MQSDDSPDDVVNWAFNLQGRVPLNWGITAITLSRAADLLYSRSEAARRFQAEVFAVQPGRLVPDPRPLSADEGELLKDTELERVAVMLLGMAVENMAKGILVGRTPSHVKSGELAKKMTGHDLVGLIKMCEVDLNDTELRALRFLTEAIRWTGRYPIPKEAAQLQRLTAGEKMRLSDPAYRECLVRVSADLLNRLWELLDAEHSAEKFAERERLAREESSPNEPHGSKMDDQYESP